MGYPREYAEDGPTHGGGNPVIGEHYTLSVWWNDSKAEYWYTLNKLKEYKSGERRIYDDVSGDKAWAKRTAQHYGIKVPKVEKEAE